MFVVVASRHDAAAQAIVAHWSVYGGALLTCEDLSRRGWQYYPERPEASTAVIDRRVVAVEDITGVLTRLSCVCETELVNIVPADRSYVAAEMTAFLLAWLSNLRCPVLNRPTPGCLGGPGWHQSRWAHTAVQLGIPVRPLNQRNAWLGHWSVSTDERYATVTVVGDRCFGTACERLLTDARRLAAVSGVDLLAVHFDGDHAEASLVGVSLWPDVSPPEIGDAIAAYLSRGRIQ